MADKIEVLSIDDFLADCIDFSGIEAAAALLRMPERFRNAQIEAEALIFHIEQLSLGHTASLLPEYRSVL